MRAAPLPPPPPCWRGSSPSAWSSPTWPPSSCSSSHALARSGAGWPAPGRRWSRWWRSRPALAALQKRVYPDSVPFYSRGSLSEEPSYVQVPRGAAALARVRDVAAHLVLFNLAAPEVSVGKPSARFPVTTFAPLSFEHLRPSGRVHAALWLGLIGLAAFRLARRLAGRPVGRPPTARPSSRRCPRGSSSTPGFTSSTARTSSSTPSSGRLRSSPWWPSSWVPPPSAHRPGRRHRHADPRQRRPTSPTSTASTARNGRR